MKKIILSFIVALCTLTTWAHDFQVDGIYYNTVIGKTNEVEVTYRGSSYSSYDNEYSGSVAIPETVTYNGTTYSVTSIGYWAFYECSRLTSITIPESVTSIGSAAFFGCSSIASVIWNAKHCGDFTYFSPSDVSSPPFAPRREDGDGYGNYVSFTFGDSVEHVPAYLCYKMYNLTSVTIPNSVTTIGDNAFSGCSGLTSVTIGNSVPTIGGNAFRGCSGLTSITIPNSVTSIGYGAFADCSKLGKVILGSGLTEIEEDAFRECKKLYDIYCYAVEPPVAYISTFANYNVNLYIPCNNLKAYQMDALFGSFKYIQCIDSEDVTTNEVVITPGTTDVTITWPAESNADTYTLVIMKDGEVVCTLTFNSEGQLLNIAFAPGREGNHPAQYAEQSANGYRFTVTGLEEGTHYTYNIDIKNAANKTIKSHSGKFTTESLTAVENTHSKSPMTNCPKLLRNGQLIIIRDGVEYNAQGTVVK